METANTPSPMTTPENACLCKTSQHKRLNAINPPQHVKRCSPSGPLAISNTALQDSIIANIWKAMKLCYGQKWTDNYGPICNNDGSITETMSFWAQALSNISLPQIQRGIKKCIEERQSQFPPTLPEFFALCAKEGLANYTPPPGFRTSTGYNARNSNGSIDPRTARGI